MEGVEVDPKRANILFHDWEASRYDGKWSISFDDRCTAYALGRLKKVLGSEGRWGRVLEVGGGTGFFGLNLWRGGRLEKLVATDISRGMLEVYRGNALALGAPVQCVGADAERLPFADASFDSVLGHAVLHHLPAPQFAFAEFFRALRPGGVLVLAGEPSRDGQIVAGVGKRVGAALGRTVSRLTGRNGPAVEEDERARLEPLVDLHTFSPGDLVRLAREAGFEGVRVGREELLSSFWGWAVRSFQATSGMRPTPALAYLSYWAYLTLFRVDELMCPILRGRGYYNLLLTARKPED